MNEQSGILVTIALAVILVSPPIVIANNQSSGFIPSASSIDLTIDFGNGTILTYMNLNGTTVLNVTESVIDVGIQWSGNLAFVTAIGEAAQDNTHYWQYWINGEYASVASNLYNLEDGDSIEWKRTSPRYTNSETQNPDFFLVIGGVILIVSGVVFLLILYYRTTRGTKV